MKYNSIAIIILILVISLATSCSKDNLKSDKPPVGTDAVIRIGNNILYSGSGNPSDTLGNEGDFYLNLSSGIFYTAKTISGWTSSIALKGGNGGVQAVGGKQSSILNIGKGSPAMSVGNIGDFYIDTANDILYGPKDTADWNANLLPLMTDSTNQSDFILSYGFNNIQLENSAKEFGIKYYYNFAAISDFIFNSDDSVRRAKYIYYNYSFIKSSYFSSLGINQIAARGMNVTVRPQDLPLDPKIRLVKVGENFQYIADSLHNSFVFTREDSLRMVSKEYPDSSLVRPLDPTMKVGERMRYGRLTSEADSIDIYDNTYYSKVSVPLSSIISNYMNLKSKYRLYIFIRVLPQYKSDSLSDTWVGGLWTNATPYIGVKGIINDSTGFYTDMHIKNDSLQLNSSLYAYKNSGPYIIPADTINIKLPYAPSDTTYNAATGGGRCRNYNADEYRSGTFYRIKAVMVPPGHSINLSDN